MLKHLDSCTPLCNGLLPSFGNLISMFWRFRIASGHLGWASALLLCILSSSVRGQAESEDPNVLFEPREYSDGQGAVLKYRLLKPANFSETRAYPLVIFLHGAGERGDDNEAQLKHGLKEFCRATRREAYPCYVLAPQCPKEQKWADVDWSKTPVEHPPQISQVLRLTMAVVDAMLDDAAINKNRVYITGLSMGGYGTWDAMTRRPELFAAAVPICGGGDPHTAPMIEHIPIACYHGDADRVVPIENSRAMIEALKECGATPRFIEYPDVGHDSWSRTYADDELFKWMFAQRRQPQ